jgi:hypothetical protein
MVVATRENKLKTLEHVLAGLMRRYQERVPDVEKIIGEMMKEGIIKRPEDIENDHIAFRTMGVSQLGIKSFEKIFLHYGYEKRDPYFFAAKKLIKSYTDEVKRDPVDELNLDDAKQVDEFLHKALWRLPTWEDYERLARESEYAAWVIYNRYYLNHFTVSVHNLPVGYDTIATFNDFLEKHGFKLNNSGGKIKKSPDGLLLQSSTVAEMIEAEFALGEKHSISGSYVEFAERLVLPQFQHLSKKEIKREHRREGFEAGNADKIFESTYSTQTRQRK